MNGKDLTFGVEDIRNLLLNNPPDVVAVHIRDNARHVVNSLVLLDQCLFVMEHGKSRLEKGEPFIVIFNEYRFKDKPAPMPALTTRAKNFGQAIFRFVVDGLPVESKAEAQKRLAVCEANDCGFFDGSVCRHIKCGCFTKIKTFFASEHCPMGRW